MGMSRVLLALLAGTLFAQDSTNAVPRNDAALRAAAASAFHRLARGEVRLAPLRVTIPTPSNQCAAPLLTMPIDQARSYTARTVPAPPVEPMPQAQVSAPACAP